MQPAKLNVFFAFFPYSGNGGISTEHPSIRRWFARTMLKVKADPRIDDVSDWDFSDTPIPMTRNDAVCKAREKGADVLVMVDSDQHPDFELENKDPLAKPFWDTSFDFLYKRKIAGLLTVVGSPYCGPPPNECVYVFQWINAESGHPQPDFGLGRFEREEASIKGGFEAVGALPTGLIMFDLAVYDHIEPPYFYYEFTDKFERKKSSTEDVTATRDISMVVQQKFGYNPLFCNWDAWAGHWKPKCVGKPRPIFVDGVNEKFKRAIMANARRGFQLIDIGAGETKVVTANIHGDPVIVNGKR
jgi:hypothetical protein